MFLFFFFFFFFFYNFLQEQSFAEGVFKIRRRLIYTYENWLDIISTTKRCLFYEPWKFKSSLLIFSHWQQLVWWAPPIRCRLAMLKWFIMIHHLWWLHGLAGCWCNLSLSCSCYNYVMAVPKTVLGRRLQNTLQHSAQLMESSSFQSQNYSG